VVGSEGLYRPVVDVVGVKAGKTRAAKSFSDAACPAEQVNCGNLASALCDAVGDGVFCKQVVVAIGLQTGAFGKGL